MVQIVASDDLARKLAGTEGTIELVDANGNRLGTLTRPPSEEDVRIANQRRTADKPGITTGELVERLESAEKG